MQAREYFVKASICFNKATTLFQQTGDDYLLPVQYRDAEKQLKQAREHLNTLSTVMDTISSLSLSDQRGIIDKIVECFDDELLPSIEKEEAVLHQTIREEFLLLQILFDEIHACLFGMEAPAPQKRTTKLRKRRHQPVPDPPGDPIVDDWRERLIKTLMKLPVVAQYDGRTALLNGIPQEGLSRAEGNTRLDLDKIISQLEKPGQLSSKEWPLLVLIKNALPYSDGFACKQDLVKIQKELEDLYG